MFIEAVLIGLLWGKVRKGRISELGRLSIRAWPLIIMAFLLQVLPVFSKQIPWMGKWESYTFLASLILLFICALLNTRIKGMSLILLGMTLNLVVVFLNGYKMPISFEGLELAGMQPMIEGIKSGEIVNYKSLEHVVNWTKYLSKYMVIPKPYPLSRVMSVGDLIITVGLVHLIQSGMKINRFKTGNRMIKFDYRGKI